MARSPFEQWRIFASGPAVQDEAYPASLLLNSSATSVDIYPNASVIGVGDDGGVLIPHDDEKGVLLPPVLRRESWAVPLVVAAAVNAAAILAFEMYVIVRAVHGTPSRRHLFLGQCLLGGLLLCALTGIPIAMSPTHATCTAMRLLVGIAPAVVMAALLVKCVFLISLNSGVYLPAHYQALLLFFIVLVQATVSIQWLSTEPATVKLLHDRSQEELYLTCTGSYKSYMLSLLYVMTLVVTLSAFSIKCRGIRENYRESSYIGACLGLVVPLWLAWTLAGFMLSPRAQPATIGFGVVATAAVVFVVMFLPKGRQLAAVGRDGLYRDDREDRLSSLSGGRYSPSFFLFQPIKNPKEILRQSNNNSIYKPNLSVGKGNKLGYGVVPPHIKRSNSYGQQYHHFAPYAHNAPYMWPLYHYYQHYYPAPHHRF